MPTGLREPINTILSGRSDPYILTDRGLRDYVRSIGFSFECLDLHIGDLQRANLGDGAGWQEEMYEYRSTRGFGAPGRWVGACWESWEGGNHFRAWKQNGSEADTGAWFLAVSTEKVRITSGTYTAAVHHTHLYSRPPALLPSCLPRSWPRSPARTSATTT